MGRCISIQVLDSVETRCQHTGSEVDEYVLSWSGMAITMIMMMIVVVVVTAHNDSS